jgi:hypothetical protein
MTMPPSLHPALVDRPAARVQLPLALRARDGRPLLVGASAFDPTADEASTLASRTSGAVDPESAEQRVAERAMDRSQLSLFAPPHAGALAAPHAAPFAISRAR